MDVRSDCQTRCQGRRGQLVEWARRAEARGFSSLGTIDRVVYENYEPLTALAAAAAVTERIGLCTLGPAWTTARQCRPSLPSRHSACTLSRAGASPSASASAAATTTTRRAKSSGRPRSAARRDAGERSRRSGRGRRSAPVAGAPRLIVGGGVDASFARAARFGDGWIAGGSGPDQFAEGAEQGESGVGGGRSRGRAPHDRARLLLARRSRRGGRARLPHRLLRLARRGGRRLDGRRCRQGRRRPYEQYMPPTRRRVVTS